MKKFIRFMLVVIGIFALAVIILGIIEPNDVVVTRSVLIKASKDAVFDQMVHYKNWPHWSPWNKMDSAIKMTYYGADGQQGSGYKWDGSDKTGAGGMTTTAVNGTEMNFDVLFTAPHEGKAKGTLKAADTAGMTKATWSFAIHSPFPLNMANAFVNMDKLVGGDFEDGLKNMKAYVESRNPVAALPAAGDVKEVAYPGHLYIGVRQVIKWSGMDKFNETNYVLLTSGAAAKINGTAAGLYYTWDTVNHSTDMAVVFPMTDSALKVKGASYIYVAPARAVMATYQGGYAKMTNVHDALKKYIAAKGGKYGLVIEEYKKSHHEDVDSNKWVTNIYYLLK